MEAPLGHPESLRMPSAPKLPRDRARPARHDVVGLLTLSVSRVWRDRVIAAATIAAWVAIGVGASLTYYLRIYGQDRRQLGATLTELAYQQIPGWRALLLETDRRTPAGARILIALPHRPWQNGYGYGFRRAQYLLQGKEAIPLLDRATDQVDPRSLARAGYIVCWRVCDVPRGFEIAWRGPDGALLRRVP